MSETLKPALLDELEEHARSVGEGVATLDAPDLLALIAAARESTPAPTEALTVAERSGMTTELVRNMDEDGHETYLEIADAMIDAGWRKTAARTAPASEVAATNAQAKALRDAAAALSNANQAVEVALGGVDYVIGFLEAEACRIEADA